MTLISEIMTLISRKGVRSSFQIHYIVRACLADRRCASNAVRLIPHQCLTLIRPQSEVNCSILYTYSTYCKLHERSLLPKLESLKCSFKEHCPHCVAHSDCHLSKRVTVESRSGNIQSLVQAFHLLSLSSNPFVHEL